MGKNVAIFLLAKGKPVTVKKVAIAPAKFEHLINEYRHQLQDGKIPGYRSSGGKLYDLLIRPVEDQIQSLSPTELAIIATDKLRYIPFETLYDRQTKQFLIQKYPINYFTRLSVRSLQQVGAKHGASLQGGVLGLGNPLPKEPFDLKAAEAEVKSITQIIPESESFIGNLATLDTFKIQAPRFRFLHLATHGCFEAQGCCLGKACQQQRQIHMQPNTLLFADQSLDIANAAHLGLQNTELLALSACQTALQQDADGQEIAGIAYLFERAGAKSVMATLWNVDDESTKNIMVDFYQNLKHGMGKGKALQQAKIKHINALLSLWSDKIIRISALSRVNCHITRKLIHNLKQLQKSKV